MTLPVKKGFFYAPFFSFAAVFVVTASKFLLDEVVQGGNIKEVPLCALKSL